MARLVRTFQSSPLKTLSLGASFLFLTATAAHAATYHVSVNGSDTAAGTSAAPWRTLQRCGQALVAGDTCIVHAGTYNASAVNGTTASLQWAKQSGTATAPIVYQAAPGETVNLTGGVRKRGVPLLHHIHFKGFNFPDGGFFIQGLSSTDRIRGWRVEGCTIQGGTEREDVNADSSNVAGVVLSDADQITVVNNEIHHISKVGTNVAEANGACLKLYNSSNVVFEHNYCHHVAKEGIGDKQGGSDNIYRQNVFEANGYEHIRISTQPDSVTGVWNARAQIYENIFICPATPGQDHFAIRLKSRSSGAQIYNNTIYGCDGLQMSSDYDGSSSDVNSNAVFRDNILVALGGDELFVSSDKWDANLPVTMDRNLYYGSGSWIRNRYCNNPPSDGSRRFATFTSLSGWMSGTGKEGASLTGNPLFVNVAGLDFHLAAGSPAIGRGTGGQNIGAFPRSDGTIVGRIIGGTRPSTPVGLTVSVVP